MRFRYLAGLAITAMVLDAGVAVAQTVQTFEDYSPCDNTQGNVGIYGVVNYGFNWTCYAWSQPPFNAHSGTNRVYSSSGAHNTPTGFFSFLGSPVKFDGAWFAGDPTNSVSFVMFLGGIPVGTSGALAPTGVPSFLSSGYSGPVDQVEVLGTGVQWIMDDVTFDGGVIGPVPVPEPASMALMGSGLLGLYGFARRRRNQVG